MCTTSPGRHLSIPQQAPHSQYLTDELWQPSPNTFWCSSTSPKQRTGNTCSYEAQRSHGSHWLRTQTEKQLFSGQPPFWPGQGLDHPPWLRYSSASSAQGSTSAPCLPFRLWPSTSADSRAAGSGGPSGLSQPTTPARHSDSSARAAPAVGVQLSGVAQASIKIDKIYMSVLEPTGPFLPCLCAGLQYPEILHCQFPMLHSLSTMARYRTR